MNALDTMAQDLEAVRRERDEFEEEADYWEEVAMRFQEQRNTESERADAMADYVEKLEDILDEPTYIQADAYRQTIDKLHPYVEEGKLPASLDASMYHLLKLLDDQSRRDARMKAEALGEYEDYIHGDHVTFPKTPREFADEYRRQAEGETHE